MKLLSICIPTYNRDKQLARLSESFLVRALDSYSDQIEIIICDNSDSDIALKNKAILDPRIDYKKNETNIGFAGNLTRCFMEASATYVWIISDDDPVLWDGFQNLMATLPHADADGVNCLMVPYLVTDNFGKKVPKNRNVDWGVGPHALVSDLLRTQIPFILISSAVVRVKKDSLPELRTKFGDNAYFQVFLFLAMNDESKPIRFLPHCAIEYQSGWVGGVSISVMAESMAILTTYLEEKFGVPKNESAEYGGWLRLFMHHRGGMYKIKNADNEHLKFVAQLPHFLSFKHLILALTLIPPKPVFYPFYLLYRAVMDLRSLRTYSLGALFKRVSANHAQIHFLKTGKNRPVSH